MERDAKKEHSRSVLSLERRFTGAGANLTEEKNVEGQVGWENGHTETGDSQKSAARGVGSGNMSIRQMSDSYGGSFGRRLKNLKGCRTCEGEGLQSRKKGEGTLI